MKTVDIRPLAEADLEDAWRATFERWVPKQADNYVDQLFERMCLLAEQPHLGRACDQLRSGYRRVLSSHHIIFYRIDGDSVVIVRILHEKMDFDAHL